MKGFYHIWAWRPSWSCDLDFLYTHWFPLPIDASYKIWLWLAKRFQRRRSLKLWTDGRTPDHGHPISSPCEPNGSGELKIVEEFYYVVADQLHAYCTADPHLYYMQNVYSNGADDKSRYARKPVFGVSNPVQHKLVYIVSEDNFEYR